VAARSSTCTATTTTSTRPLTIAVDANGADQGPGAVARGAARSGERVVLFGPAVELASPGAHVEVVDAPVSIAKATDPARAVRSTPESSIVQAVQAVAEGKADALVSGGSTGAALAAGLFFVKRGRGIHRPALAIAMPVPGAPVLLLDVGASVEVRPEHLVQFAFMGAAFAQAVLGVQRPRVALLSNGEEPGRGTPDVIAAHERLVAAGGRIDFVGNVEGTQVTEGVADVVVMDGFTGNITLKLMEGVSSKLLRTIRDVAMASPRGRLGGLLLRRPLRALRDDIDPEQAGGAYMLGLRRTGVVAHGRFTRAGFARAIDVAARGVREDVVGRTLAALEQAGALRATPAGDEQRPSSEPPASVQAQ
jgi:phosphate acyltransferase